MMSLLICNLFKLLLLSLHYFYDIILLLLKAAFNLYPDKEYCLISLPTQELHIPLLESMTAVDYREDANIRHSLYICHRDSTLNIINVRKGDKKDIEKIDQLIKDTPEYTTIMHKLKLSLLSSEDENNINENNESETNENENKENEKMCKYYFNFNFLYYFL